MTDDPPFRVSQAGAVTDRLRQVMALAKSQRRGRSAAAALEWVLSELERTPVEFGEGRYADAATSGLLFRIAFARPLCVEYAVAPDARQVFVRRWQLLR